MNYTNQCDLSSMGGKIFPSILALNLPTTTSDYTFSGMYTPLISLPYVPPEAITVASAISYTLDGRTIFYPTTSQNLGSSNYQNLRIRILGAVQENGWYTGMKSDPQVKVDFFNTLRRSIAILTRNRNDYSQAIFSHTGGDIHIGNSTFATKRSIITEGGDIMIDGNIDLQSGTLAIIAMRDPPGSWTGPVSRIHSASTKE